MKWLICLGILFNSLPGMAANRFWVATGSGNWNSTANWSSTSGGVGGATVPVAADLAYFDSGGAGNCNLNIAVTVAGIRISNYAGTIVQGANTLTIASNSFTMSGGTFIGSSAAIQCTGYFSLTGGSFTSTTGTFSVGGNLASSATLFAHLGGTFSHASGLVEINPNYTPCSGSTFTVDVIAATRFHDLRINANSSCTAPVVTSAAGDTLKVEHDLIHENGMFNGVLTFKNDLRVGTSADGGSGVMIANGTAAQQYHVTLPATRTATLVVDKTAGALSPGSATTALSTSGFKLVRGSFTAPSGRMKVGGSRSISDVVFQQLAGTFVHNNGLVDLDPYFAPCSGSSFTVDVLPATRFYDVRVAADASCNSAIVLTAVGDTVMAEHDLTHENGVINGLFGFKNDLWTGSSADGGMGQVIATSSAAQQYHVALPATRTAILVLNKPAGTLAPGPGTTALSISGYKQVQGDFIAPTGRMSVGGTRTISDIVFQHTGGAFTHNGGSVDLDPYFSPCSTGTFTVDVIPSTRFYDVRVAASASCGSATFTTAAGDTLKAVHDLTHENGYINGLFSFKNDLWIGTSADGGMGQLIADNNTVQQYHVAVPATRTCYVVVDKSAGSFTYAPGTTDIAMSGFWQLRGDFVAPTGSMAVGGPQTTNSTMFRQVAGSFAHSNGQVIIDPHYSICAQGLFTVDVLPATRFYDVQVAASAACGSATLATAPGDTVMAMNDLKHENGYINGLFSFKNDLWIGTSADGGMGQLIADNVTAQQYRVAIPATRTCYVVVDKAAGAFSPAPGTTAFSMSGFWQLRGDFVAPAGNMNVGGPQAMNSTMFRQVTGSFAHGNGQVVIDPHYSICAQGVFTVDVIPATRFYDVLVTASAACGNATLATAPGDTVMAVHDLTHENGYINGLFSFKNDLWIGASADGGMGQLIANSTTAQQYHVTTPATRTCYVVVNKGAGAFTPAAGTTRFSMSGFWQLQGDFVAPVGNMNVGGSQSGSGTVLRHASGTFAHNSGQVVFDPLREACSTGVFNMDVIPSTRFYDLELAAANTCGINAQLTTAVGDTVRALNDLRLTNGMVNGLFSVQHDLFVEAGTDAGTGQVVFDHPSAAQTYRWDAAIPRSCQLVVDKAAGSVTPAGTTRASVTGLKLVKGHFQAPSDTLRIGGVWSGTVTMLAYAGGTFDHNGGTTILDPQASGCSAATITLATKPAMLFNKLRLQGSGCATPSFAIPATDTLACADSLYYINSPVNTGFVSSRGNVVVAPTFDSGSAKLIFNGSGTQHFNLNGATALFDGDVILDKPSGIVLLTTPFTMDAGASQKLDLRRGHLQSSATNLLVMGDNVTTVNASVASFVRGPLRKVGNDAFSFPVGANDTAYAPIQMTAPTNTAHHFTAEYFWIDPETVPYPAMMRDMSLDHLSRCEYWRLDRTNGTSTVAVTLSWAGRSCGVTVPSALRVARWNGSQWKDHGNGAITGTVASGTVRSTGLLNDFGVFTLASATSSNPLPVELITFDAIAATGHVDLRWVTGSELNNDHFVVEKTLDGQSFTEVVRVAGTGNSQVAVSYADVDPSPWIGVSYYRLKQVDVDGTFSLSQLVSVNFNGTRGRPILYPNPTAGDVLWLDPSGATGNIALTVLDATGRVVAQWQEAMEQPAMVDISGHVQLTAGTYTVRVDRDGIAEQLALVVTGQ